MRQRMTLQRPDRNGPCWCGSGIKYKHCHQPVEDRILAYQLRGYEVPTRKLLKTPADVEGIKKSAAINMAALDAVAEKIRAGMSTEEINTIVRNNVAQLIEVTDKDGMIRLLSEISEEAAGIDRSILQGDVDRLRTDIAATIEKIGTA